MKQQRIETGTLTVSTDREGLEKKKQKKSVGFQITEINELLLPAGGKLDSLD